jgi:hypothetical protein
MEKSYIIKNFINFTPHLVLSGGCDGWTIYRAWNWKFLESSWVVHCNGRYRLGAVYVGRMVIII